MLGVAVSMVEIGLARAVHWRKYERQLLFHVTGVVQNSRLTRAYMCLKPFLWMTGDCVARGPRAGRGHVHGGDRGPACAVHGRLLAPG